MNKRTDFLYFYDDPMISRNIEYVATADHYNWTNLSRSNEITAYEFDVDDYIDFQVNMLDRMQLYSRPDCITLKIFWCCNEEYSKNRSSIRWHCDLDAYGDKGSYCESFQKEERIPGIKLELAQTEITMIIDRNIYTFFRDEYYKRREEKSQRNTKS